MAPTCLALTQIILTAIVALTIGLVAAGIANEQRKIAAAKLKLDLFEQRYRIFMRTWKILSMVVREGTRTKHYGLGTPFNNFIPKAKFLFGADVEKYLNTLATQWTRLHAAEVMERPSEGAAEKFELTGWFKAQADTGVKEVFGPYLSFERWK